VEVSVAFLEDLSAEGATERALPVLHAVELAFATAALQEGGSFDVEVVPFDVSGSPDPVAQVASEVVADDTIVAAIAAPDLGGQAELAAGLAQAEVPLVSLSARGSVSDMPAGTWLRLVAPLRAQAAALADAAASLRAARRGICVAAAPADGTVYARTVRRALPADLPVTDVAGADEAIDAGCGVVVWPGGALGGAELAIGLAAANDPPAMIGGPALQDPEFLERAGETAEGAVSLCSCAEVSTSLDLAAQRFIQDYQSEFGSPPGPYAVEAWDAGHLVARALREAGPDRADLMAWLAGASSLDGLGGPYAMSGGELADPAAAIRRSRVEGGRWVAIEAG
jgi:ABC-type branched-subunit amino acid transport system substrate-binding protein